MRHFLLTAKMFTVIPCHYRTFPALAQTADALVAGLPGVKVIEPQVLQPITL